VRGNSAAASFMIEDHRLGWAPGKDANAALPDKSHPATA
jgi:hypothetical protein